MMARAFWPARGGRRPEDSLGSYFRAGGAAPPLHYATGDALAGRPLAVISVGEDVDTALASSLARDLRVDFCGFAETRDAFDVFRGSGRKPRW